MNKNDPKFIRAYDRGMLRSAFKSMFWGALSLRKKNEGLTFKDFAKLVGVSKHEVSRWFSGDPNWTINTIANIADALAVELRIEAVDRKTGRVFSPSGVYSGPQKIDEAVTSGISHEPTIVARKVVGSGELRQVTSSAA